MLRVRIKQRSLHENGCFCLWRLFKIFATIWPLCFALSSDLNSDLRNRIEQTLSKMWANFLKVIERGVKQNSSWKKFQFYNNINLYVSTTDVSRKYTLKILDKWNGFYTGAERSLQIPEDLGSNPVTGNFYWAFIYCLLYYRKVTGNSPFLKHYSNRPKQAQIKQFENIFSYRIYFTE